jgi:hypothetical protein
VLHQRSGFHRRKSPAVVTNLDNSAPDRRSWVFHGVWLVLLAMSAWWRFSLPLSPVIDNDYGGYLNPALRALTGHPFEQLAGRAIFYPGLIYGLLALTRDFRSITLVQHTLGLATGLLLLATWCAAGRALRSPHLPRWFYDLAGLVTFAVFIFAPHPVYFEFFIRADVVCPFFAALSFFLIVRFLLAWRLDRNSNAAFGFGVAALFESLLLPHLKPSFWLSTVFTTIPIWCAVFDRREKLAWRMCMVVLPLAAAGLLLFYPEWSFARADTSSRTFVPESLFSIHGLLIRDQLEADLTEPSPGVPFSRDELRTAHELLDGTIAEARRNSPTHLASLGYDPDWLLYHSPFFTALAETNHWSEAMEIQFCRFYYLRTWMKNPAAMLRKVWGQLRQFYGRYCPAYIEHSFTLQKHYRATDDLLHEQKYLTAIEALPAAVAWRASAAQLHDQETVVGRPKVLAVTLLFLSRSYLWSMLAWIVTIPAIGFQPELRRRFGLFTAIVAVGYGFNFGNNLGIAITHTLEVARYTYIQFATTLLTQMLTGILLLEIVLATTERLKSPSPSRQPLNARQ